MTSGERQPMNRGIPLRVLVVDGSDGDVRSVEQALRDAGWNPEIHRGDPAVPVDAQRRGFDVVVGGADQTDDGDAAVSALEQAVAARDQFLNLASHELKTPLTSLQLQLQSLSRSLQTGGAGTEKVSERIRAMSRSTARLGELVNRLLDVSQIASRGHVELVREDMDLAEVVREVVTRFQETAAEAGSTLAIEADGPVRGSWDRMRLDAMLTNLVSNALKYGLGKPVAITLREEDGVARLAVRDHGIGIAPEDQARIFERFERAVPDRHYGGFGLGLWVARLVVEEHGGTIRVASIPGAGSLFTVELPREDGANLP